MANMNRKRRENWKTSGNFPLSVVILLLCPAIAACTTFWNGLLAGILITVIYAAVYGILFLTGNILPEKFRFAAVFLISAALSGIAAMLTEAYFPEQYAALKFYLPLSAVHCTLLDHVLGRDAGLAELCLPFFKFIGMFACAGLIREFLGAGTLFGLSVLPSGMEPIAFFQNIPGAFLTMALILMALRAAGLIPDLSLTENTDGWIRLPESGEEEHS